LLSLAIADDVGAILVIAIGYTSHLNVRALGLAFAGLLLVLAFQRLGVRAVPAYVLLGIAVWLAFHESGVHATLAGVLLGLLTPAQPWVSDRRAGGLVTYVADLWKGEGWRSSGNRRKLLRRVETAAREAVSPLERLEERLHPRSAFLIMPLFALANAGVPFRAAPLTPV
jgi:NhaA family Na+:H+ antiporter